MLCQDRLCQPANCARDRPRGKLPPRGRLRPTELECLLRGRIARWAFAAIGRARSSSPELQHHTGAAGAVDSGKAPLGQPLSTTATARNKSTGPANSMIGLPRGSRRLISKRKEASRRFSTAVMRQRDQEITGDFSFQRQITGRVPSSSGAWRRRNWPSLSSERRRSRRRSCRAASGVRLKWHVASFLVPALGARTR